MQDNLDVVISFVVIIIALSVFLQLVMDMIKNLLNLKWGVYEGFLKRIYARNFQFEPLTQKDTEGKYAKIKNRRTRKIGSLGSRLTGFYRQVNRFLMEIEPYKQKLLEIREGVGNAVTNEEKLKVLADGISGLDLDIFRQTVGKMDKLFEIFFKISSEKQQKVDPLLEDIKHLAVKLDKTKTPGLELMETIDSIFMKMTEIEKLIRQFRTRLSEKVEDWRRSLENHYERSIATWTFWVGLFVVIALNADAVVIYNTLRNETAVRANIISQSDMLSRTPAMPSRSERLNAMNTEAKTFKERLEKDDIMTTAEFTRLAGGLRSLGKAIVNDAEAYNQSRSANGSNGLTVDLPFDVFHQDNGAIVVLESLESEIEDAKSLGLVDVNGLKDSIDGALMQIVKNYLALQTRIINSRKNLIYSTDLPVGWDCRRWAATTESPWSIFKKILGCFFTAILISFGAPFWNNILKSLFGIRSFLRNSPQNEGNSIKS